MVKTFVGLSSPKINTMLNVIIPHVGESISEVTLSEWLVKTGDYVNIDQTIANVESEKASFEIHAEKSGRITILIEADETIEIGKVVAQIDETAEQPADEVPTVTPQQETSPLPTQPTIHAIELKVESTPPMVKATPLASAIAKSNHINLASIPLNHPESKLTKNDVLNRILQSGKSGNTQTTERETKSTKMSPLRKTIARRLLESKNATAMLTTFNEVDMSRIMQTRKQFKDKFKEAHNVNLGFMSFFIKAACHALEAWPSVNSYIEDDHILSHNFCDISIAVSTPKGLVVPVIRNAERLSMAEMEMKVVELANKARDNKLTIEEMTGGTFTLTNGGVFGSLMSTPIINSPQSAILGMHKIQERPVAIDGKVDIRPMMYLALSYDHRIIDGKESVSFLVMIKELLENPEFLLTGRNPLQHLLGI